ncbi:MAG: AraC family transcriptional regulator [Planctomycetes bacterium]|nr:AraC family transcriptional regulator [Planctomycetota bacterium]
MVSIEKKTPEFFSDQVLEADRFYLDTHSGKRQSLKVVCGGCEHCRPGYRINRADFPFYSIEFVARGKGSVTLRGSEYDLFAGRVFSYGPGIAHMITTVADDPFVKYFVDFTGPEASNMLHKFGLTPGQVAQVALPEVILRIFEDLIKNGQTGSPYTALLCTAILQQLILKTAETSIVEHKHTTAAFYTYQSAREIIRKNCLTLRSLDQIAEECRIDGAYLCRLFKRFDNQSPYQYLMRLKMNAAAQRLQSPNTSVKEVAFELGFGDPFHFSRAFKRIFGMPPSTFKSLR